MCFKKLACFLVVPFLVSSCASTHDFSSDGHSTFGGGYKVTEIQRGTYRIVAKTNVTPWTNFETARKMWHDQAKRACGEAEYMEQDINEYSYENSPRFFGVVPYVVSAREGYAVCVQATTSTGTSNK